MATAPAGDKVELVLADLPECHVFRLPPRSGAGGFKAEEWEGRNIWTGRCRVIAHGEMAEIRLDNPVTGDIFAKCPIDPAAASSVIEPVSDSSRYFVLRIEDGSGRHAYIGIGFTERTAAFDFSVAITDFKQQAKRLREEATGTAAPYQARHNFTLAEGETIELAIGGKLRAASHEARTGVAGAPVPPPPLPTASPLSGSATSPSSPDAGASSGGSLAAGLSGFAPPPAAPKRRGV